MNDLSWILYLADVAGSLNPIFGVTLFFSVMVGVPVFCMSHLDSDFASGKKIGNVLLGVSGVSAICLALIPSKETIYLIAASEAGEAAVDNLNPEITKVRKIINDYLDETLKEDTNDR